MPQYPADLTNGPMFTRHPFGEPKWQLESQSEFDGLAPSQIVRYISAGDRGFEDWESQGKLGARLDATPDADNLDTNAAAEGDVKGVTVDAHRYVVDPLVDDRHEFKGLYTGGPLRVSNDPTREGGSHKRLRQVLTRTFCAGHGYWVDDLGRYHPAWPDGSGGWTGRNPDEKQVVFKRPSEAASENSDEPPEGAEIREYMTADDALKAHRPWLDSKLSPYMALHPEAFPNTFVREVYWREFTHESIAALEELGSDRARLEAVVAYHFTEKVAPQVLDAHCRLDPQTNTVVFVCSLMYVDLGEPESPDDLIDLPCLVAPCTRETLRMFGWNQLRDGEGYKYTHVFRWPRLKDTPEVRRAIEFVKDNKAVAAAYKKDEQGNYVLDGSGNRILLHPAADSWILALLAKHDPPATGSTEPPGYAGYEKLKNPPTVINNSDADELGVTVADNTGRLTAPISIPRNATVGSGDPFVASTTSPAQFYRIAQQQVQVEQDGSLSFSIGLVRTEWHGSDDGHNWEDTTNPGTRQLADVSSAEGWGKTEHRVIPSVPRENAIPTMLGIEGSTYRLVIAKRQTEGGDGHSDVSFQEFSLFNYGATNPSDPTDPDKTPVNVYNLLDGSNAVSQSYNPYPRPTYSLTYERVAPGSVGPLIDKIKGLLGGDPAISVVYHPEGYYTVTARGTGKTPRHIEEWLVSADWFHHETVEQWLGVTLGTKGGTGPDANERGFYDTVTINPQTGEETRTGWHSLAEIRGDLDANWMGAETSSDNSLRFTTGNGAAAVSGKSLSAAHGHAHGHWSAMGIASDPDTNGGNGEPNGTSDGTWDTDDKKRSHALTHVRVSTNEDGTHNLTIHRNYPHQRVWVWREKQATRKGRWRYVYHAHYRNWPSRHAIYNDLVTNLVTYINSMYNESVDLGGDDWSWRYSPSVNIYGLVDDGGVAILPVGWNSGGKKSTYTDEGLENKSSYEIAPCPWKEGHPTKISPESGIALAKPGFHPLLGHCFRIRKTPLYEGHYDTERRATRMYNKIMSSKEFPVDLSKCKSPSLSGSQWVFTVAGTPTLGPKGWVYNGEYPDSQALTISDREKDGWSDDKWRGEDKDADVSKLNSDLQAAGFVGIPPDEWERWWKGGTGSAQDIPAGQGGDNGGSSGGNSGSSGSSSGSGGESGSSSGS